LAVKFRASIFRRIDWDGSISNNEKAPTTCRTAVAGFVGAEMNFGLRVKDVNARRWTMRPAKVTMIADA